MDPPTGAGLRQLCAGDEHGQPYGFCRMNGSLQGCCLPVPFYQMQAVIAGCERTGCDRAFGNAKAGLGGGGSGRAVMDGSATMAGSSMAMCGGRSGKKDGRDAVANGREKRTDVIGSMS